MVSEDGNSWDSFASVVIVTFQKCSGFFYKLYAQEKESAIGNTQQKILSVALKL
jgi:hypothetical protein